MYDTRGRTCPKHPNLVHPCQICANPSSKVSSDAPENTIVDNVNWFLQSHIPYNTEAPRSLRHDNTQHFAEREGLDAHWDNPNDKVLPNRPNYGSSGDIGGVANVTIMPSTIRLIGLQAGINTVDLAPLTIRLSVPAIIDEPVYNPATQLLIITDSFDQYATIANAINAYPINRNTQFMELVTGRGGVGKAIRLNYAGVSGADDILFGPEGRLSAIGTWNGELPQVPAPYTHFHFTTWIRFSAGADPGIDPFGSGVKGIMLWHNGGQRYQHSPHKLRGYHGERYAETRWDVGPPHPPNTITGLYHWKTPDGEAPIFAPYADGNWHRFTVEVYAGHPVHRGERLWLDGVLVFDNMDNIGTTDYGTGTDYTYTNAIAYWHVFGNFVNSGAAQAVPFFTVDFDDWRAWV